MKDVKYEEIAIRGTWEINIRLAAAKGEENFSGRNFLAIFTGF
jgi:hypothetical protein